MADIPIIPVFCVLESVYLARAYYIVARLKIADLLAERPMTVDELAKRTETCPRSLYRVLRALAAFNVFLEDDQGRFTIGPEGVLLRSNVKGSVRGWTVLAGLDECWNAFGKALEVVQTGSDGYRLANGRGLYDDLDDPNCGLLQESFATDMSNWTEWQADVVVSSFHFGNFTKLVDVAGGKGKLITAILRKYPHLHGVLLDRPYALNVAAREMPLAGIADRCELCVGDIFVEVPSNADGYLLKHILRDWSDSESVKILQNIHVAMPPNGTLLVIDGIIDPNNGVDRLQKLIDLEQMFWLTGALRTQMEWDALFEAAGFVRERTIKTVVVDMSIMVVRKR